MIINYDPFYVEKLYDAFSACAIKGVREYFTEEITIWWWFESKRGLKLFNRGPKEARWEKERSLNVAE